MNCLDGIGAQGGLIVVATANDPLLLDAAILKRLGRFDRVVSFRPPERDLCVDTLKVSPQLLPLLQAWVSRFGLS